MAGLPAAAPLRSIRSELNRECQVRIKAGSGRPRPSPFPVVFLPPPAGPHHRANEPVSLYWLIVASRFHPGSPDRPSLSRLRSSSPSFAVQQVIFFQFFPPTPSFTGFFLSRLPPRSPVHGPRSPPPPFALPSISSLSPAHSEGNQSSLRVPFRFHDGPAAFFPLDLEVFHARPPVGG